MYRWRKTIAVGLLLTVMTAIGGFTLRYILQKNDTDRMRKKTFQFSGDEQTPPESTDDQAAVPDLLIGHVRPFRETTVSAPVSGTIRSLNVRAGQKIPAELVPKDPTNHSVVELNGAASTEDLQQKAVLHLPPFPDDQVLARLETRKIKNRLREVNARIQKTRLQLQDAERTEQRIRQAIEEGGRGTVYSQQDLDEAVLKVNVTESELKRLRARRRRLAEKARDHYIHAPFPGVVRSVHTEVGEWVSPGQPIFTFMEISRVKVVFYVTERLEPVIRNRDRFSFSVDAYPNRETAFRGRVYSISPATDSDRHQFRVELSLTNPEKTRLKPGMICRVHLERNSD